MKATRAVLGLLAVGVLVISACGDEDDEGAGTSAPNSGASTTQSTQSSGVSSTTDEAASTSAAPATSTKFDPSLPPVKVGFHNLEGGSFSIPESRIAFESGVEYVNNELGGINGHELQVEYCNLDVTPESSINCANQFVEADVVAAVQGYDVAIDAALPILKEAGILEIGPGPLGPAVNSAVGDAIMMGASTEGGAAIASLVLAGDQGAEKVAYLFNDLPAMHGIFDTTIKPLATELGYDVEAYYYPSPTDWTTFAPTVLTGGADWINLTGADGDFLAAIPAFRNAGFTGILNAGPFTQYDQLDPEMLQDVIVSSPYYTETMMSGVPAEAQADIDIYKKYLDQMSGVERAYPTRNGFYMAVMAADVLRQVDDPTDAAAVLAQGAKAKGHVFFTDLDYDCETPSWPGTTSCTGISIWAEINPDFTLTVLPDQPVDLSGIIPES